MIIEKHQHDCKNERLWSKIGCYLANPSVIKELAGCAVSTEITTWWLALDSNDNLVGFCAARHHKNGKVVLTYSYVVPEYRNRGVYNQLFYERLDDVLERENVKLLESVVNTNSIHIFLKNGFKKSGYRGKFVIVQKEVNNERG